MKSLLFQDVSNFDTEFTGEAPVDSVVTDSQLSKTVQEQFTGECRIADVDHRLLGSNTLLVGFSYNGTHFSATIVS